MQAQALFDRWATAEDAQGYSARHNFEKTKFFVEAGFIGFNYLSDVLEWLGLDLDDVEEELKDTPDDPDLIQLRQEMVTEMGKINDMLDEQEESAT